MPPDARRRPAGHRAPRTLIDTDHDHEIGTPKGSRPSSPQAVTGLAKLESATTIMATSLVGDTAVFDLADIEIRLGLVHLLDAAGRHLAVALEEVGR